MALIYAVSDIHACLKPFKEALELINLNDKGNQLVLCGDYMDYGTQSCEVLYRVKELTEAYPNQVIALLGNHEDMFLEFLYSSDSDVWNLEWLGADKELSTVFSLISGSTKVAVLNKLKEIKYPDTYFEIASLVKEDIFRNHSQLIDWIKSQKLYHENDRQIFVHAGIDEEAEEYWKHGTSREVFLCKYPATIGTFYKDIIAGHVSTSSLAGVDGHDVFWDGQNHYYLDGDTNRSGKVPLLKYDTKTRRYSSFKTQSESSGHLKFEEYIVGPQQ